MKRMSGLRQVGTALLLAAILVASFALAFPRVARAEGPVTPAPAEAQYAISACAHLPLAQVIVVERMWDDLQGAVRNLTTDDAWKNDYPGRTNLFASLLGCPQILVEDGHTTSGTLTFAGKIYAAIGHMEWPDTSNVAASVKK